MNALYKTAVKKPDLLGAIQRSLEDDKPEKKWKIENGFHACMNQFYGDLAEQIDIIENGDLLLSETPLLIHNIVNLPNKESFRESMKIWPELQHFGSVFTREVGQRLWYDNLTDEAMLASTVGFT